MLSFVGVKPVVNGIKFSGIKSGLVVEQMCRKVLVLVQVDFLCLGFTSCLRGFLHSKKWLFQSVISKVFHNFHKTNSKLQDLLNIFITIEGLSI